MKKIFSLAELPALAVPDDHFDVRFIHTENITVAFNRLKAGAEVPLHEHLHETIDFVQEGELLLQIGQEQHMLKAGTVAAIPSNVPHAAKALTDCSVINIFYPARTDFS
jgi:quercetin dioxygenase-like cupin family protein